MATPDLLAVVERSPSAAAAHDRAAWVGLFDADALVEDPVGSRPHVGLTQIGRFYDTFIGPRDITFHRDLDIVGDGFVIRDLELEVAMGPAVTMHIPAFLRYDLRPAEAEWKITALRAYWDLPAMVGQFLRNGLSAAPATVQLSRALLGNQGLSGTMGFALGFRRVRSRHTALLSGFLNALGRGDTTAAARALAPDAPVTCGDSGTQGLVELGERLDGAAWSKMIGAGYGAVVAIDADSGRGVLFADLSRRGDAITRIRYFPH